MRNYAAIKMNELPHVTMRKNLIKITWKQRKPDANEYILHDPIYVKFKKLTSDIQSQINGYLGRGGRR